MTDTWGSSHGISAVLYENTSLTTEEISATQFPMWTITLMKTDAGFVINENSSLLWCFAVVISGGLVHCAGCALL